MSLSSPSCPTRPSYVRLLLWAVFCLGWLGVIGLTSTLAQEPAADAPAAEAPAAEAPAAPASEPAPAGAEGATNTPAPQRITMLGQLLQAHSDPFAALIGLILLGLSIYFLAQVIRLSMEYRVSEAVPPALVETLETSIQERKFQEAYDACRENNSFLAKLIRTGIANLPNGRPESKEAMNLASEEQVVMMESRISYLATIGTLGPMIGLVGTIWGMIHSFQEISSAGGTQPRADQVAAGISTALFITLEGVALSVPAIFFYAFFRNRIAQIAMEATKVADRTIAAFWSAAKQQQTAQPASKA